MKRSSQLLLTLVAAFSLLAVACGDDEPSDEGAEPTVEEEASFAAGSTMATLSDAGTVKVGVKFDQPGLGSRSLESDQPVGFDVEIAKIIAGRARHRPRRHRVRRDRVGQP